MGTDMRFTRQWLLMTLAAAIKNQLACGVITSFTRLRTSTTTPKRWVMHDFYWVYVERKYNHWTLSVSITLPAKSVGMYVFPFFIKSTTFYSLHELRLCIYIHTVLLFYATILVIGPYYPVHQGLSIQGTQGVKSLIHVVADCTFMYGLPTIRSYNVVSYLLLNMTKHNYFPVINYILLYD